MSEAASTVRASDGRRIAYCEYGRKDGHPVLFCQGAPSSRLMHPDETITSTLGAHLVVIDRPGFGRSDPMPGRRLVDFAADARQVLAELGIARFSVAAVSGGGPYAAAVAHTLGAQVLALALVSCSGPLETKGVLAGANWKRRAGYWIARHTNPTVMKWAMRLTDNPEQGAEGFMAAFLRHNPAADQALLARPEVHALYIRNFEESQRQGIQAFAEEVCLASRPWGFALGEIGCPVDIWHGILDSSTPLAMAREMARQFPNCQTHFLEGEGHLFIYGERWRDILLRLLDRSGEPAAPPV